MRWMASILFICLQFTVVSAQEAPVYHAIDKSKWEKAVDGLSYTEKKEETKEETIDLPQQHAPVAVDSGILKTVGFIVIGLLLVFIIFMLFGRDLFSRNKKVDTSKVVTITELDDHPMETDLERFLREATERSDYRLAIRIYYLMLLKALHDRNFITWKKNKTNMDYMSELTQHPDYHQLVKNTSVYEFVWYGDTILREPQFASLRNTFTGLITKISGLK